MQRDRENRVLCQRLVRCTSILHSAHTIHSYKHEMHGLTMKSHSRINVQFVSVNIFIIQFELLFGVFWFLSKIFVRCFDRDLLTLNRLFWFYYWLFNISLVVVLSSPHTKTLQSISVYCSLFFGCCCWRKQTIHWIRWILGSIEWCVVSVIVCEVIFMCF